MQPLNDIPPIYVILLGNFIEVNEVQLVKELFPILTTVFGMLTDFRVEQSENVPAAITLVLVLILYSPEIDFVAIR